MPKRFLKIESVERKIMKINNAVHDSTITILWRECWPQVTSLDQLLIMKHVILGFLKQLWTLICVKLFKMSQYPMNRYDVLEGTGSYASVMNSLVSLFKALEEFWRSYYQASPCSELLHINSPLNHRQWVKDYFSILLWK